MPITTEQILALLAEHPARIAALTAGLTNEQLANAPGPGEWSVNEILAHLRSCADVWGGGMVEIVQKDHPTIRAINPRTWIERTDYRKQDFWPSLQAFTAQREGLLAFLVGLTPAGWTRTATVTGAGKPIERGFFWYAEGLATHERAHVKQIAKIAAALRS